MSERHSRATSWTARIEQCWPDGDQATSLAFTVPTDWTYRAGQYITVGTPAGARHYSLASSPRHDDTPYITVKGAGAAGRFFCEDVRPGHELPVSGPHGGFVLRDASRPLFFFGAGSGMVPLASMAVDASYDNGPPIVVVGAYSDSSSAIAMTALRERANDPAVGRPVTLRTWYAEDAGFPTMEALARFVPGHSAEAHAYACGPQGFVDLATAACVAQGMDASAVFTEGYS